MTLERTIDIDGTEYPVVLSDDPKTLLAAKAAGRVVVGLGGEVSEAEKERSQPWLPVNFVAAGLPVDEAWLEGAVRRELGIPWKIAETDRLIIREFSVDDCGGIPDDAGDSPDEAILKDPERLQKYIDEQYAFFDCGMWALVRKEDGRIVGMISLTPADVRQSLCELGYHIYTPYRRCGYAEEACERILELLTERNIYVTARADSANTASVSLLKKLGFEQVSSDCFLRADFV